METNRRSYLSIDDLFEDLNAKDKGRYIVMDCPCCEVKNAAFSYKKNLNFISCNRQNECGETTLVTFEKEIDSSKIKLEEDTHTTPLSVEKQKEITLLSSQLQHLVSNVRIDHEVCKTYRGLSQVNYSDYLIKTPNNQLGLSLAEKLPHIFENYDTPAKKKLLENRDVIIPYFDKTNKVDRLLLRSSQPLKGAIKEINVLVQDNKRDAKDYHLSLSKDTSRTDNPIIIAETIIDGLSLREIDKNCEFIAVSGVNHMRQAMSYVSENKEQFKERSFIIAMDNDRAGEVATQKWETLLTQLDLTNTRFEYPEGDQHDLNDLLTNNKAALIDSYSSSIHKNKSRHYLDKLDKLVDSVSLSPEVNKEIEL